MNPQQQEALRRAFRETFDLDPQSPVEDLAYQGLAAWDSVGHMRLVAALETAFDLMLDTDEVIGLSSFAKAVEIVGRHLGVEI
ncbi:MAG: acyl carrier protein [Magnetospirillum sp.]